MACHINGISHIKLLKRINTTKVTTLKVKSIKLECIGSQTDVSLEPTHLFSEPVRRTTTTTDISY